MILFLVLADPVYILDELGIQKNSFVGPYRQDFHYAMLNADRHHSMVRLVLSIVVEDEYPSRITASLDPTGNICTLFCLLISHCRNRIGNENCSNRPYRKARDNSSSKLIFLNPQAYLYYAILIDITVK